MYNDNAENRFFRPKWGTNHVQDQPASGKKAGQQAAKPAKKMRQIKTQAQKARKK